MVAALAGLVVVAALAGSCAGSEFDPGTGRTVPPTARAAGSVRPRPATPPPPSAGRGVSTDGVTVWADVAAVPQQGGDVVLAVRNAGTAPVRYGVPWSVAWWDGGEWVEERRAWSCLESWPCVGLAAQPGSTITAPAVLLTAPAGGDGPLELIDLLDLDPGWYRLSKGVERVAGGSVTVSAVVEVSASAPLTPPAPRGSTHRLTLAPALVAADREGQVVRVSTVLNGGAGGSVEELQRVEPSLSSNAEIERWDGERWARVGTVPVDRGDPDQSGIAATRVRLPSLPAGAYRLVRRQAGGREVPGLLFSV